MFAVPHENEQYTLYTRELRFNIFISRALPCEFSLLRENVLSGESFYHSEEKLISQCLEVCFWFMNYL